MSEYTREEILNMIEEAGGPENLDLSGKDLSGIDLSREAISKQLEKYGEKNPDEIPAWFSEERQGIDLRRAILKEANLSGAHLQGAELRAAHLEGASLEGAHLEKVDLIVAKSLAQAYFYAAWLDRTRMTKDQLSGGIGEEVDEEYFKAKEAYLLLKNNFNQVGRYDDASWAYVKERQMEKMTYHPKLARKYYAEGEQLPEEASWRSWRWRGFYVKYTLKWVWGWLIELLCGYGEKPGRVLRAMLLLLVIAPFAYGLFGGLTHADGTVATALDYLIYSFDAFTRIVGTDLVPLTMWGHLVTGLEAFLAVLLASLFIYTLGRRMSRS